MKHSLLLALILTISGINANAQYANRPLSNLSATETYQAAILADNPIMYWRLGETSGTIAYDESSNHRDATYINNPTLGQAGAINNDPNTAVGFNGINQYASWIPTSSYTGAFTVEAWVKANQVESGEAFFDTRTQSAEFSFDFKLGSNSEKVINFDIGDGSKWLSNTNIDFDYSLNIWYYVVAVVTTTGATCYVDGSEIGSAIYDGTPLLFDLTHSVAIGTDIRYNTEWFDGTIDEVAVYDYALSGDQIAAHYATGIGTCETPSGTTVSNITSSSAQLNWNATPGALAYQIRYKAPALGVTTIDSTINTSKILENLSPLTKYSWQVRSLCGKFPPVFSDWSKRQVFMTNAPRLATDENISSLSSGLEVYPNPCGGQFYIELKLKDNLSMAVTVQILNLVGQTVYQKEENMVDGRLINEINLDKMLRPGMYLVRIVASDSIYSKQIVLQR